MFHFYRNISRKILFLSKYITISIKLTNKYLNKQKIAYVSGILIKEVLLNSKQYHIWLFDFPFYELEQFTANFIFFNIYYILSYWPNINQTKRKEFVNFALLSQSCNNTLWSNLMYQFSFESHKNLFSLFEYILSSFYFYSQPLHLQRSSPGITAVL